MESGMAKYEWRFILETSDDVMSVVIVIKYCLYVVQDFVIGIMD